jgi:Zn-dependent protease
MDRQEWQVLVSCFGYLPNFSLGMLQESILIGFYFLALLYSVIIHEVSHGMMALWLGDTTAKYADRLNLNPIKHVDPFGSVLLPALLILTTGSAFGWAKPVPYNPYNLKDQKWGPLWVALAGPGSNLILATVASVVAHALPLAFLAKEDIVTRFFRAVYGDGSFFDRFGSLAEALSGSLSQVLFGLLLVIIFWNVVLACFNLLPFPPLDGSKLLYALFPIREETKVWLEHYGIFFLLFAVFFLAVPISLFIGLVLSFFVRLAL